MSESALHNIRFDERGLIPAIVQDASNKQVLALCYMDNASLVRTLQTGQAAFLSSSGSFQGGERLLDIVVNPDGGSITVLIERDAAAEEKPASLLRDIRESQQPRGSSVSLVDVESMEFGLSIQKLYNLIADRNEKRPEGSYTTYLFNSGTDKILKKVAEESGEVIIAAKNNSHREIISELADLFYHLLVLMVDRDVKLGDILRELDSRASQAVRQQ
ncbi:MAG TPA: phosphoribosyl-ATP diphosphatase [Blastocatellia bacterium]|nr:phosphoribosyl-ATP diphosphatase [Blastocatellia bacterium]